jgi:hypothetical protein
VFVYTLIEPIDTFDGLTAIRMDHRGPGPPHAMGTAGSTEPAKRREALSVLTTHDAALAASPGSPSARDPGPTSCMGSPS